LNFYRRFPSNYANDTRHLTFAEHGAYTLMLDYCYAQERPLPADPAEIHELMCARTKAERDAIDSVLAGFFRLTKRGYTQKKVKKEIEHFRTVSKARSANGRKGGISRQANARQMPSKPQAFQKLDARGEIQKQEEPVPLTLVSSSIKGFAFNKGETPEKSKPVLDTKPKSRPPTSDGRPMKCDRFGTPYAKQDWD